MKETDLIEMEINIAGERLKLKVPFPEQNLVRDAERLVVDLFRSWKARHPAKKTQELLVMVAYQFARQYAELSEEKRMAIEIADSLDDRLSRLLASRDEEAGDNARTLSETARTDYFTDY